ncbi:hypothetical protein BH23CHL7_BH23CHL7_21050 [soil metagenome]
MIDEVTYERVVSAVPALGDASPELAALFRGQAYMARILPAGTSSSRAIE